ncbi:AAA family ATPase [Butyrivibrio fibrisolvens]|uniref:AAA family ATPase n=1 Tax=Butyrivibrio fibrisolvens TaxID=831 RepID=UPI0020BD7C6F|nr:AAA family ATPase [Butyrivibrio fibrisolvens]
MRIIICGLNGAGKSTLGRALAKQLHYEFRDIEDYYFPKTDDKYEYSVQRTEEEVAALGKVWDKKVRRCYRGISRRRCCKAR